MHIDVVATDFDGVINSYSTPWIAADVIPDPPVEGSIEWLEMLTQHYEVVVHSTRAAVEDGADAIAAYLKKHGLSDRALSRISVTAEKPIAQIYLDDRGWRFEGPGTFPTLEQIAAFQPWNRRRK